MKQTLQGLRNSGRDVIVAAFKKPCALGVIAILSFSLVLNALSDLQYYVRTQDTPVFNLMLDLRVPTHVDNVYLNLLGFILPAIIGMCILFQLRIMHLRLPDCFGIVLLIVAFLTLFSFFVYPLQLEIAGGSGTDIVALALVIVYVFWLITNGNYKQFMFSSFFLGFIIGMASDIGAVPYNTGVQTFGGGGLLDGDFTLSISLLISALILDLIVKRLRIETEDGITSI